MSGAEPGVALAFAGATPVSATDPDPGADLEDDGAVDVAAHLRARGLIGAEPVQVESLSGGVSNDVVAVDGPGTSVVVKRALRRLRVAEEWLADPGRVLTEAKALQAAARWQPDHVPPVLDVDPESRVIVIGRAESGAHEWKTDLLDGAVDMAVAAQLGGILAVWHRESAGDLEVAHSFASVRAFHELRVDPFYRWVGLRHPDVAPRIDAVVQRMDATRACLVHGDFSPKNVLVGRSSIWVIDWEVAHYGDPSFDVAFLVTHLLCKGLYRPSAAANYQLAASEFMRAYRKASGPGSPHVDPSHLTAQVACLLLARMDGKSPVPYLDELARARGRTVAHAALLDEATTMTDLWSLL